MAERGARAARTKPKGICSAPRVFGLWDILPGAGGSASAARAWAGMPAPLVGFLFTRKPDNQAEHDESTGLALLRDRFSTNRQAGCHVSQADQNRSSETDFGTEAERG